MIPSNNIKRIELIHMISTVKYNIMGYIQPQFECAKSARRIYHIIGNQTTENYTHLLRQNIIKNLQVIIDDINLAENIFGTGLRITKRKYHKEKT